MRSFYRVASLSLVALAACEEPPPVTPGPVASASANPSVAPPPTTKTATKTSRVTVSFGHKIGGSVVTFDGEEGNVVFDVHENGRGPRTEAKFRLAKDGTLLSYSATGHHELGSPVSEKFSLEGGKAQWKSIEEQGEKTLSAPAFYAPLAALPDALGWLAEALYQKKGPLPLLPSGEARMEKVGEATLRSKSNVDKHVVAYAILGVDLSPDYVWLDDAGKWFGTYQSWSSTIPEDFDNTVDSVVQKQTGFQRDYDAKIVANAMQKANPAGLAFTHARVLDVQNGKWLTDQTVVVVGENITAVGPSASTKVPAGATTTDLAGKAILPGLWDMHSHLSTPDGSMDLACGVTTARDVGNDPDELDDWKKRFDDGTAPGPHVMRFGFIEGRGEHAASSKITATTEEEAKAGVAFYSKRGYDGVKIYNSVKPELVPIIAKEAHAKGMMVSGHIPVHMLANEAVRDGYDGIEHINMLFLNFFATHDTDTRTPLRFSLVAENAAGFDLKSKPMKDFIAVLRDKKIVVDPTVGVFEDLFIAEPGHVVHGKESLAKRLPAQIQRSFLMGGLPQAGKDERYAKSWDQTLALVKLLRDEKVPLVAGTDSFAGVTLQHEIMLFVRAGIPTAEAIRMATLDPARFMKKDKTTGSITVGKTADLFVVDGDPLANIGDITKVVTTVRSGRQYDPRKLEEAVGLGKP